MDVTDTYIEQIRPDPTSPSGLSTVYEGRLEHVVAIPETFRINARARRARPTRSSPVPPGGAVPAATLIVPRRNNGPIVSLDVAAGTALSVQYAGFSGDPRARHVPAVRTARATSTTSAGADFFDVGSQNWVYADVRGNIAYFTSAEMPLREDLRGRPRRRPAAVPPARRHGRQRVAAGRQPAAGQALPYEILPPARCRTWSTRGRLLRQRQQRPGRHDAGQQPAEPDAARSAASTTSTYGYDRLPRRADHRHGARRTIRERPRVTDRGHPRPAGRRHAAGRAVLHAVHHRRAVDRARQ